MNNTLRGNRVLTWEKKSLDKKNNSKEKANNSIIKDYKYEKNNSLGNNITKKNCKTLSSRPNSLLNYQRNTTLYSSHNPNAIHILKQSLKIPSNKKHKNQINKLTFSNPNLM